MTDKSQQRLEDIVYWWEQQASDALKVSGDDVLSLKLAFQRVLTTLSEAEFDRFAGLRPRLIYRPDLAGLVFHEKWRAVTGTTDGRITFIYLAPVAAKLNPEQLANLIAHEVAHVVLHSDESGGHEEIRNLETEADSLSHQWGFETYRFDMPSM